MVNVHRYVNVYQREYIIYIYIYIGTCVCVCVDRYIYPQPQLEPFEKNPDLGIIEPGAGICRRAAL